ncbi:hypothetical protein AB5I41_15090 [Sphingomonas sp. MMS24-JH45]
MRALLSVPLSAIALLLAGCGGPAPANDQQAAVAALDAELTGGNITGNLASSAGDPALTAALRDQIMVDPALVQQANDDAIRPPTQPADRRGPARRHRGSGKRPGGEGRRPPRAPGIGRVPACAAARRSLTLGALAQKQGGRTAACAAAVSYSAAWANRLPAGVPLYPDARVAEAAGADGNGCALRVVSFASGAPMQRLLDWYFTRVSAAGYTLGHQADGEHVLGGRSASGGAFLAIMRKRADGGTDVDLMADGG